MAEQTDTPKAGETYSPVVAGKDSAWLVGKLSAANALISPTITVLSSLGVHLDSSGIVYKSLPYIIFVILHLAHDWASVKSDFKWV